MLAGVLTTAFTACGSENKVAQDQPTAVEAQSEAATAADSAVETTQEQSEEQTEGQAEEQTDTASIEEGTETSANSEEPDEYSKEFIENIAKESAPAIDITGCDTFTQIVDKKLEDGMGYANVKVGDEDLLLVSSGTYDNMDGNMAAIDAVAYAYKDGAIVEVGSVCSAGTAYPLAVKDGYLYSGSNHWICKYTVEDYKIVMKEKSSVEYDENGNGTYYYESEEDSTEKDPAQLEKIFENLYNEMAGGEIINFDTINRQELN